MSDQIIIKTLDANTQKWAYICDFDRNGFLENEEISVFKNNLKGTSIQKSGQFFNTSIVYKVNLTAPSDQTAMYNLPILELPKRASLTPEPPVKTGNDTGYLDYDSEAGKKLAEMAYQNRNKEKVKNKKGKWTYFLGLCATFVKKAMLAVGLMKSYITGNGCDMAGILRKNPKFKEIPVTDTNYKNPPAGTVLCYGRGKSGYSSEYGHVEIALGDAVPAAKNCAVSDGITRNIRKSSAMFVPIKT